GRLKEGAAERVPLAAEGNGCALAERIGDVLFHLLERLLIDERALVYGACEAVADSQLCNGFDQLLCEPVVDPVLHEKAVDAYARLPRVAVLARDRACDSRI